MRVLITGVTGFVGPHLAAELRRDDAGTELWGLTWGDFDRTVVESAAPGIRLVESDLTRPGCLDPILERARPDVVYHLAAASSVARSWESAARCLEINALGTAYLFDAVGRSGIDPVIVISSTAEIYGRLEDTSHPIGEPTPPAPLSPYGTSKLAQDLLAAQYHTGRGLATVRLRFFHLTGPGRPPHFVASSFARQIARAELGLEPPVLRVGNLGAVRDFTDVRDAVRACRLAADARHAGEVFHVCTGREVTISALVETLLGMSRRPIDVEVDPALVRRADVPWLVGDPSKIRDATGWRAEIPLERTLEDLLDWWRERESASS